MGNIPNHTRADINTSPIPNEPTNMSLLEALKDAVHVLEQVAARELESSSNAFSTALNEYRNTVAWAKQRVNMFSLTAEDVHAYAHSNGIVPPLTADELQLIKRGLEAGLAVARDEALDAALGCVIDDRAAERDAKS